MDEDEDENSLLSIDTLLLVVVLFVGIVVPGIARRVLGSAGYDALGQVVFLIGYAGMVFILWYGWIRPLNIVGPD